MSHRSPKCIPQTPPEWQHVNIEPDANGTFKLTTGIFSSLIGWQTCQAAKVEKGFGLTMEQALTSGSRLDAWLQKQEKR